MFTGGIVKCMSWYFSMPGLQQQIFKVIPLQLIYHLLNQIIKTITSYDDLRVK